MKLLVLAVAALVGGVASSGLGDHTVMQDSSLRTQGDFAVSGLGDTALNGSEQLCRDLSWDVLADNISVPCAPGCNYFCYWSYKYNKWFCYCVYNGILCG
jgi:hypothetical protein